MTPDPRVVAHERETERSYKNLSHARQDAKSRPGGYNSQAYRQLLIDEFKKRIPGMEPYEWQLDVSEALYLGLDSTVIAGTGAGKTMPFVMPLFAAKDKVFGGKDKDLVIIISPLNSLEEDQAQKFNTMGLSAAAVNKDTYTNDAHKAIQNHEHNVIITSPELCLEHDRFRSLLSDSKFARRILAIIIDEAHCITQWGNKFRPIYQTLGTLRSFVAADVPFLSTSATLTPLALAQVRQTLDINSLDSFHLNLGTDRPNIAWFVRQMNAGKSDLDALNFVLLKNLDDVEITELVSTMVFFDDISVALDALKHLRNRLPEHLRSQIAVYNSRRSARSKRRILQEFREGKIKILLTTEAAGMGCDLPNIERVVQFMVPGSLSIWIQRAGRAGRNRAIKALAFLLVQPTVFQEMKSKTKSKDDKTVYRKDVEADLRVWIETKSCRREPQANTFDDHRPRTSPAGFCCDNCLRKQEPNHSLLRTEPIVPESTSKPPVIDAEEPVSELNDNGKRPMVTVPATRKDTHLSSIRTLLEEWRYTTVDETYSSCSWGVDALLPPKVLTAIATKARLSSVDDLIDLGWSSLFAHRHGLDVLERIAVVDSKHYAAVQAEIDAAKELKRQAAEEKARQQAEQKEAEKKAKEAQKAAEKQAKEEKAAAEKKAKEEQKAAEKKAKEERAAAEKAAKERAKEQKAAEKKAKAEKELEVKRARLEKEKKENELKLQLALAKPKRGRGRPPAQSTASSSKPRPKPRPLRRPLKEQSPTPPSPSTSTVAPLPLSPRRTNVNHMPIQTSFTLTPSHVTYATNITDIDSANIDSTHST